MFSLIMELSFSKDKLYETLASESSDLLPELSQLMTRLIPIGPFTKPTHSPRLSSILWALVINVLIS